MSIEKAKGIVIRLSDYSETSQVAAFLTDTAGVLRTLAKGSKRPNSPTGGALDLLTVNELVYTPSKSGGLATLREARATKQFAGVKRSTKRYYAALYAAELSGVFGEGSEGSSEQYELLSETLEALSQAEDEAVGYIVLYYESHVMRAAGVGLNLGECARCGKEAQAQGPARVSLEDGGILCGGCEGGIEVGGGSLAVLKRIGESTIKSVQRLRLSDELRREASALLTGAVVYSGGRVPKLVKLAKEEIGERWRRWAQGAGGQAA